MIRAFVLSFATLGSMLCWNQVLGTEQDVRQANAYFEEAAYRQAILAYEDLLTQGYYASHLFNNLGYAYAKEEQYAKARLNFEKALLLAPASESIRKNLRWTRAALQLPEKPEEFVGIRWVKSIMMACPTLVWYGLSVLAWAVVIAFWIMHLYRQRRIQRKTWVAMGVVLILSVTFFLLGYLRHQRLTHYPLTIIVNEHMTPAYNEPYAGSPPLQSLRPGQQVVVLRQIRDWAEVQAAPNTTVWVKTIHLGRVSLTYQPVGVTASSRSIIDMG